MNHPRKCTIAATACILLLPSLLTGTAQAAAAQAHVTVNEDEAGFTLSNGVVTARVLKASGDIRSLIYKGTEILTDRSGHAGGYWSHDASGGTGIVTRVTIDPARNGGERAEVSVKGISGGTRMGHGPGASAEGDFPADIEIRYALGRGDAGIYTYCIFNHRPEYPAATMTEARFAVKLADFFDWISVDKLRNKSYPRPIPTEDKYVYTAVQFENRASGFSSTTRKLGFYLVNPSVEYLSGGPTKPEFLVHRDTTTVAAPVVLNYWRSSHYGGANVTVAAGESWNKVIGPFLLYVNEGATPDAMWRDARAKAEEETRKWPYSWVDAEGYQTPAKRAVVSGRLVLHDPAARQFPGSMLVGLAPRSHDVSMPNGRSASINWQTDAKHYQFWVRTNDPAGRFSIPHVVPGDYVLYALADGVLGQYESADIRIAAGKNINLGEIVWTPVRRGKQLWEIGIPDRTAAEFSGSQRFFEPGIALQYATLFPNDVTYTIGTSRPGEAWFYAQVPHANPEQARSPGSGTAIGRATPFTIRFRLDSAQTGMAILRLAICGTGARSIDVAVNGKPAGTISLAPDGVIARHQIQGLWYERENRFDSSLLKAGDNTLTLTVPAGSVTDGVIYDYLRLELDNSR